MHGGIVIYTSIVKQIWYIFLSYDLGTWWNLSVSESLITR